MDDLKKIVIKDTPFFVLIEDGKPFIGHAFVIITTNMKGDLFIVSSLDEKKNATFFFNVIHPHASCLEKSAIHKLRENSQNLFNLQGLSLDLYQDVPSFFSSKLFFRVYFLKIPCVHRILFEENKKIIDAVHRSGREVPPEWRYVNALTFLPINFINFDMIGPDSRLLDDGGKDVGLGKIGRCLLKASGNTITKLCKNSKMMTVCSIKLHTSSSWTNGTTCYYYRL